MYVYVASSWRNKGYFAVIEALKAYDIPHFDFRNPEESTAFSWDQVGGEAGSKLTPVATYLEMIEHPIAESGFIVDFTALQKADTVVLILPCGRSAHLELGYAVGAGKRTAILLENPVTPELMYKMVDHLATSLRDLMTWIKG